MPKRILAPVKCKLSKAIAPEKKVFSATVTINTPKIDHAGTDANVYFVINAHRFLMDRPKYDDFEKGDTDSYTFPINMSLDEFRKSAIEIGHDNTDDDPGWYCGRVTLYIRFEGSYYNNLYKWWPDIGWLAADENQGELWAVLQTGTELQ